MPGDEFPIGEITTGNLREFQRHDIHVFLSCSAVVDDDAIICVYDLAKFGGDMVVDIMRTDPMIVIGGMLQENPFFVPPEAFLRVIA